MIFPGRDAVAVVVALGIYQRKIVPLAQREMGGWRELAETIPDPVLRAQALTALDEILGRTTNSSRSYASGPPASAPSTPLSKRGCRDSSAI